MIDEMSKLKVIELQNFMSIGNARLEFDDSNIIDLCGYNDSGKSAITRALEVMFYNSYSQEQVNFIKDDEDFWAIGLEFSDGVDLCRYKYADGKSVYEMWKDKKLLYTNKNEQGTIFAVNDIPEPIQKYLGVISVRDDTMNEKLNVRRNVDKLFLINTSGGENYKMLNTILRSEILADASKNVTRDKNAMQTEVSSLSTSCLTLKNELNSLDAVDDATLDTLRQKIKNLTAIKMRAEYLQVIVDNYQNLKDFVVYDEIPMVDPCRYAEILSLYDLSKTLAVPVFEECTIIDVSRLQLLSQLLELHKDTEIVIMPEVTTIDITQLNDLRKIGTLYNEMYYASADLMNTEKELKDTQEQLGTLAKQYDFKICKNCGTVVL